MYEGKRRSRDELGAIRWKHNATPTTLADRTADDEVATKGRKHRCTSLVCRCMDSVWQGRDSARRQSKTSATS